VENGKSIGIYTAIRLHDLLVLVLPVMYFLKYCYQSWLYTVYRPTTTVH